MPHYAGLLLLAFSAILAAQGRGLQPGASIPAFRLPDQNGAIRDWDSVAGSNGTVLVFYRSADW
jgi:hypothetical protein